MKLESHQNYEPSSSQFYTLNIKWTENYLFNRGNANHISLISVMFFPKKKEERQWVQSFKNREKGK